MFYFAGSKFLDKKQFAPESKLVEKGKQNNQVEWEKNNADVTLCHDQIDDIKFCNKVWPSRVFIERVENCERLAHVKYFIFVEGHPIMLTLP